MAAQVTTHISDPFDTVSLAPSYATEDPYHGIELDNISSSPSPSPEPSANALLDLPPYAPPSTKNFNPTLHLQIQTSGKPLLSLPLPQPAETVPIFDVVPTPSGPSVVHSDTPRYLSVRPSRNSGSCYLVPGPCPGSDDEPHPLSTTTYRFGPGRPPQVELFRPGSGPIHSSSSGSNSDGERRGSTAWDSFPLESLGLLTRSQRLRTRLGTFEWRYATRSERRAAASASFLPLACSPTGSASGPGSGSGSAAAGEKSDKVGNLLVLDRIVRVSHARNSHRRGKLSSSEEEEEIRTPVAWLVRGPGTRSPGSKGSSAGNGGRLLVDLGVWDEGEKGEREMVVVMVVTTAMSMLKKEVDRRRAQQIAVMASIAGAG